MAYDIISYKNIVKCWRIFGPILAGKDTYMDILTEFMVVKKLLVEMDISTDPSLLLMDQFWRTDNWSKLYWWKILTNWQSISAHCFVPFYVQDIRLAQRCKCLLSSPSLSPLYALFLPPGLCLLLQCSLRWMRWVVIQGFKASLDIRLKTRNKIKFLVFLFLRGDFPGKKKATPMNLTEKSTRRSRFICC